jgi:hypothetical protein
MTNIALRAHTPPSAGTDQKLYFTPRAVTAADRWLILISDRDGAVRNLLAGACNVYEVRLDNRTNQL